MTAESQADALTDADGVFTNYGQCDLGIHSINTAELEADGMATVYISDLCQRDFVMKSLNLIFTLAHFLLSLVVKL